MKILYFSSSKIPSNQANSIQVMRMCSAFVGNGHEVILVSAKGKNWACKDEFFEEYGIERIFELKQVRRLNIQRLGGFIYGMTSSFTTRNVDANLLYGRCPHSLLFSALRGLPFIYEAHDLPRSLLRHKLEERLFRCNGFTLLVVISDALRNDYCKKYPHLKDNIIAAHDAAACPQIDNSIDYCTSSESDSRRLKICYAGSLYPGKGVEGVVSLARVRPEHQYTIVGGSEQDINHWKAVASNNITFMGRMSPSAMPSILRQFDILLLSAQSNIQTEKGGDIAKYTSPLKLFEYMASGRPIISSNLPVLKEVLEHERNALLASPDDPAEWGEMVDRIAEDKELAERLSRKAFDDLCRKYTWLKRAELVLRDLKVDK